MSSAPRSLVLTDAALAIRTIHRRSRRQNTRAAANMEEQRNIALAADSETRLPATHPIDRRWDQSRLVLLENVRRNGGQPRTWSPSNGIVFAEDRSASRVYASKMSTQNDAEDGMGAGESLGDPSDDACGNAFGPMSGGLSREVGRNHEAFQDNGLEQGSALPGFRRNAGARQNDKARVIAKTALDMWASDSRRPYSTMTGAQDNRERNRSEVSNSVISDDERSIDSVSLSDEFPEKSLADDEDYKPSQDTKAYPSESEPEHQSSLTSLSVPDISGLRVTDELGSNVKHRCSARMDDIASRYSPPTYYIPPEQFRHALLSSQNTMASYWSHKLYRNADDKKPLVLYCSRLDKAEEIAQKFVNELVLGFDLEWEPYTDKQKNAIKQKCSLIQLASEKHIALFHVAIWQGETAEALMPPTLRAILESRDVLKVGVNAIGDAKRVNEHLGVKTQGIFELSHLYRVVEFSETQPSEVNKKPVGLSRQVRNLLGLPLGKGPVRMSHWSRHLTTEQTDYAASDAYAGLMVFHALEAKRKRMNPTPPLPALYEDQQPLVDGHGRAYATTAKSAFRKIYKRKREDVDGEAVEQAIDEGEEDDEFQDALEEQEVEDETELTQVNDSQGSSQRSELALYAGSLDLESKPEHEAQEAEEHHNENEGESAIDSPLKQALPKSPKRGPIPSSPEVTQANTWITSWHSSRPDEYHVQASDPKLRAYHLWHEQRLDCSYVAALLGDPPLKMETVASYVMDAIRYEHLAFETERFWEVWALVPKSAQWRYQRVLERVRVVES